MLHRAINQDGGYSSRTLTRIDEPSSAQWAMATRLRSLSGALFGGFRLNPGHLRSTASDPSLSGRDRLRWRRSRR
jgi:hypothetical protein